MNRYFAWWAAIVLALVSLALSLRWPGWWWGVGMFGALALVGLVDQLQRRSTLRRNYPLLAHFRYGLESIGPEMRQYFIEGDTAEVPFSRLQRALVYQRAKSVSDVRPFGTQQNVYAPDFEWLNHSMASVEIESHDFRVVVGPDCEQPYSASVFNISAMSFGALSPNAVRALNAGARAGGFFHDTGEGSISRYHREHGGDLVWEIGSGYFGCRDEAGGFSEERFVANATDPQVKMIELKLSQGAKPGKGGLLPGTKVNAEIAEARGIPVGEDCLSPSRHSAFSTPVEMMRFLARLRTLSGGKPVGFKLALGHPWEWFGIAKAMHETGLLPDFIVVDGSEGGTGAAPSEFINHVGVPLQEALMLVHNTLVGLDLRERIRIGAAGRITCAFDIARTMAMGADWCNAARAFMFAVGCIQAQTCHNDKCPTGVTSQDPSRWRHLDVVDKSRRVQRFHDNTLMALRDLIGAAGLVHPQQLGPEHILRRESATRVSSLAAMYRFLKPGELLDGVPGHTVFKAFWADARSDSFEPPERMRRLRETKSR